MSQKERGERGRDPLPFILDNQLFPLSDHHLVLRLPKDNVGEARAPGPSCVFNRTGTVSEKPPLRKARPGPSLFSYHLGQEESPGTVWGPIGSGGTSLSRQQTCPFPCPLHSNTARFDDETPGQVEGIIFEDNL